jgi:hypothetical protein
LLSKYQVKSYVHRDLSQRDKALIVLASFDIACQPAEMRERAVAAGLRAAKRWNFSGILARRNGLAISVPGGWEITEDGREYLRGLGISSLRPAALQVAADLRVYLSKINNIDVREFVEEAISCLESNLHKTAIVTFWLAAVTVLHRHVINKYLSAFNSEAKRIDSKWKIAVTADDLGRMKQSDFLDRINAVSMIGKNTKSQLIKALDLRNGRGHPSSLKISSNAAAAHIEILLLNVFDKFQI